MWSFAVGLFLITLSPGSLRLTAIYGFVSGGAILLGGAIIGDAIDRYQRLAVARTVLLINNISVAVCAVIVALTLQYDEDTQEIWDGWLRVLCEVAIVITATVGDLASVGRTIAIERDWIVVMCAGNKQQLTSLSARLRRIDLVTNLAAPIITGQIITYGSSVIGAAFLGGWNVVFMPVEYGLLYAIHQRVPGLQTKTSTGEGDVTETTSLMDEHVDKADQKVDALRVLDVFITTGRGWKTYVSQDILPAGIALALLYMTVLGFDNITTGYAVEQGLTESIIGVLRGVGAIFGVSGTLLFPLLRKKFGLKKTGVMTFFLDVILLSPCVVSVFVAGSPFVPDYYINHEKYISSDDWAGNTTDAGELSTGAAPGQTSPLSIWLLMTSIVVSRAGLWMCDLTVTQLLLEEPHEDVRGIVNGVQSALNKFMDLIKFVLVIVLPLEETFGYLILASFACVSLGGVSYSVYACKPTRQDEPTPIDVEKTHEGI